jgi:hypothetical protein
VTRFVQTSVDISQMQETLNARDEYEEKVSKEREAGDMRFPIFFDAPDEDDPYCQNPNGPKDRTSFSVSSDDPDYDRLYEMHKRNEWPTVEEQKAIEKRQIERNQKERGRGGPMGAPGLRGTHSND